MENNLFHLGGATEENVKPDSFILTTEENDRIYDLLNDKLYQDPILDPAELACLDPFIFDYKTLYSLYADVSRKSVIGPEVDNKAGLRQLPYITDILSLECSETQAIHFLSKGLEPHHLPKDTRDLVQKWLNSYQHIYQQYTEIGGRYVVQAADN